MKLSISSPIRTALALLCLATTAACAEGLANAPSANRDWTPEDLEQDAIANGPRSCPREGPDPLAPPGERRLICATPAPVRLTHVVASP
ncbi:hypothetical protein SOCE26_029870 [Sorangium cellulosum]|uniref:Secreted protein n=1 Tax=Sorangium cellulosum TaxID=56 RepID=A0A2L0EQJ5_SORCE|nr:hypothetical protein [Sorangium cellulosum]AUX41566.1 hypothetical protein SOCE26_029870 [Sorangium cellulosum]